MTRLIPRTMRDAPGDLSAAHALLLRGGYIRQVARGHYALMPLGFRVWRTIRDIIFDEMERAGVLNIQMPIMQPRELWDMTGRWDKYQASRTMFTTVDAHSGNEFGLAPTAEEVVTWLVAQEVTSYRDIGEHGLHMHQIGWKFRDELRPHGGMLRGREFDMSDAYSFDLSAAGMQSSFEMYRGIYDRVFTRVGLREFISVQADSGAIGGQGSAEFMALSEIGEDTLITCNTCDYGANRERAGSRYTEVLYDDVRQEMRHEHTPGTTSVDQLVELFGAEGVTAQHMVKTIIFTADPDTDGQFEVAVCIRGDLEVNAIKVRNALGVDEVVPAAASVVVEATGAQVGFAGPLGLMERGRVRQIFFDRSTQGMTNFLCGCNETDYHRLNVNFGRDLAVPENFHDLHAATTGHSCPNCDSGTLRESKGMEVGHIFMLQTGYAEAFDATYTDADGERQILHMGCYGIGTTRLMQAIVEQNRDEHGIIWPVEVAPYQVHIVPINWNNATQREIAEQLEAGLQKRGLTTLLDDRTTIRAGAKFADADLIGCPWRITVGRDASQGLVEVRDRRTGDVQKVPVDWVLKDLMRPMDAGDIALLKSGQRD